jgi:hypothetical protein
MGIDLMASDINSDAENPVNIDNVLNYEKDPKFVDYMKSRLDAAIRDREDGNLIDSDAVFTNIRDRYGWQ